MKSATKAIVKRIKCPKCGYVWNSRVPYPKACPECKVRLGWFNKRHGKKEV